jgi:hypothetical protein
MLSLLETVARIALIRDRFEAFAITSWYEGKWFGGLSSQNSRHRRDLRRL